MRLLLYAPYGYAIALLVIGFIASRRREWNGYFWGALALAEVSRLGQMLFLVQNFGHPIYLLEVRGQFIPLNYTGIYTAIAAGLAGLLIGMGLYVRQKSTFPGLWVAGLSFAEVALLFLLRIAL